MWLDGPEVGAGLLSWSLGLLSLSELGAQSDQEHGPRAQAAWVHILALLLPGAVMRWASVA